MKLLRALSHPFRMLRIVRFVWKARRPSTVHDMPAVVDIFWIRSGYEALTFFGTILTHSKGDADAMNRRLTTLKNHEMIHLRQAQSTGDSWWRFYRLYLHYLDHCRDGATGWKRYARMTLEERDSMTQKKESNEITH